MADAVERVTDANPLAGATSESRNAVMDAGGVRAETTISRNADMAAETRAALEAHERITSAGGDPRRAEERERRRRASHAARFGTHCGQCGAALEANAPVWLSAIYVGYSWMGHYQRWQTPLCQGCCRPGGDRYFRPRWCAPQPCEGCGRPVYYRPSYRRRRHVLCSARGAWLAASKRRTAAGAAARRKACAVCGTVFDAPRRDAVTCSAACRQRAYRQRKS
jgi:hypothetical protein